MRALLLCLLLPLASLADMPLDVAERIIAQEELSEKFSPEDRVRLLGSYPQVVLIEFFPDTEERDRKNQHREKAEQLAARFTNGDVSITAVRGNVPILTAVVRSRSAMVAILRDRDVRWVTPDKILQTETLQSLPYVEQPTAVSLGADGHGEYVVIIDSGIDPDEYPYSIGAVPVALDMTGGSNPWDHTNGHGTVVAGMVWKTAPQAKIISLKAVTVGGVINSVDWIIDNDDKYSIGAVNMSFAIATSHFVGVCDTTMTRLIDDLFEINIPVAVAAGNEAVKNGLPDPACGKNAISVGAIYDYEWSWSETHTLTTGGECTDEMWYQGSVTCFSNSSVELDILAPGCEIYVSTTPGQAIGDSGWSNTHRCGTSLASPVVAATAAMAKSKSASITAAEILGIMSGWMPLWVMDGANGRYTEILNVRYVNDRATVLAQAKAKAVVSIIPAIINN